MRKLLLEWFDREKRRLPWRGERDPYRILVSEIMLQQTRVAVVEPRYTRFLSRFPTIDKLACAREQSVLAEWSGLGYYRRARALHAAAKRVVKQGRFPQTSLELLELPGIGRYTANAVASIAFGEAVPVVDGNVKRVLSRICDRVLSDNQLWEMASVLLDGKRPGDFNQALMELGAVVCVPRNPRCTECPVRSMCNLRSERRPERVQRRTGVLEYGLARRNGSVLLQQRSSTSRLMANMWEFPGINSACGNNRKQPVVRLRHSITNTDYSVLVYEISGRSVASGRWISVDSAKRLALTGVTRKILDHLNDRDHSLRNASVGSTAVARRAGR